MTRSGKTALQFTLQPPAFLQAHQYGGHGAEQAEQNGDEVGYCCGASKKQ
jgi:hypothetical protein